MPESSSVIPPLRPRTACPEPTAAARRRHEHVPARPPRRHRLTDRMCRTGPSAALRWASIPERRGLVRRAAVVLGANDGTGRAGTTARGTHRL
jgi:hypothetical protein